MQEELLHKKSKLLKVAPNEDLPKRGFSIQTIRLSTMESITLGNNFNKFLASNVNLLNAFPLS